MHGTLSIHHCQLNKMPSEVPLAAPLRKPRQTWEVDWWHHLASSGVFGTWEKPCIHSQPCVWFAASWQVCAI